MDDTRTVSEDQIHTIHNYISLMAFGINVLVYEEELHS